MSGLAAGWEHRHVAEERPQITEVDIPETGAEGELLSMGGIDGGISLRSMEFEQTGEAEMRIALAMQ